MPQDHNTLTARAAAALVGAAVASSAASRPRLPGGVLRAAVAAASDAAVACPIRRRVARPATATAAVIFAGTGGPLDTGAAVPGRPGVGGCRAHCCGAADGAATVNPGGTPVGSPDVSNVTRSFSSVDADSSTTAAVTAAP